MSIETLLAENTAALKELTTAILAGNESRDEVLKLAKGTPTASGSAASKELTVAEIKDKVQGADLATLQAMLGEEENGKNRQGAIKAIQEALDAITPAAGTEPATEAPKEEPAAAAAVPDGEKTKGIFSAWFSSTNDEGERAARREFIAQISGAIGATVSTADEDGRRKALFYLERKKSGLDVDFKAEYDFAGDPKQDVGAEDEPAL